MSSESATGDRPRGSRAVVGALLFLVGVLASCGGCGGGFVLLAGVEPPHPVWANGGPAGAPIAISFTGAPKGDYDLELSLAVDPAHTRPDADKARYLHSLEFELDLTRGTASRTKGPIEEHTLDAPSGGVAHGYWHITSLTADPRGEIQGSVVIRPNVSAHGLRSIEVDLAPGSEFGGVILAFLAAGLLGLVLSGTGLALVIVARR